MQPPAPTRWVSTYRAVPDFLPLAREHGPAHAARLRDFRARGLVLMAGPMTDPFDGDAMAVFVSREAAEEFIAGDPFVTSGAVAEWSVRGWAEALGTSPGE
ncbi:YciI family protein [Actinomycetospora sp. NBRC 106378]|uniref:YciI family protein n=1 Tax=Actinomycetospora sp. NBRC 106378 TaxID=3032208 RepID=UPI0024A04217|nr:YciI family protein [Actinomycetospora sp. NBRC 106378]GLZ55283.1 hypothetical protein Acsp07_49000 [Actinomycetospora sp. NBRC 106378]